MSVKPMIFSGPMVRALIEGRKTQARRVLKAVDAAEYPFCGSWRQDDHGQNSVVFYDEDRVGRFEVGIPYAPGDMLWVREAHSAVIPQIRNGSTEHHHPVDVMYAMDGEQTKLDVHAADVSLSVLDSAGDLRPSIHMPRWASRLTLEVTDVRVQRLQEISHEDAIAEGIARSPHGNGDQWIDYPAGSSAAGWADPRDSFRSLWNSINAARGYGWETDPWVIALTFAAHRQNVDALLAEREAA